MTTKKDLNEIRETLCSLSNTAYAIYKYPEYADDVEGVMAASAIAVFNIDMLLKDKKTDKANVNPVQAELRGKKTTKTTSQTKTNTIKGRKCHGSKMLMRLSRISSAQARMPTRIRARMPKRIRARV